MPTPASHLAIPNPPLGPSIIGFKTVPSGWTPLFTGLPFTTSILLSAPVTKCPYHLRRDQDILPSLFLLTDIIPQFLACLKGRGASTGLNPTALGTHSLRRGLASDWALKGISDRLRREHRRWRSAKVADCYIDTSINIQLLLMAQSK
jgi:hypothetical protein